MYAKYFMGAKHAHSQSKGTDFNIVTILYVNAYGDWACKGFYCSPEFLEAVSNMVDDGLLAIGDPVTVSVFEKNIEDICRDDRFFETLNLNKKKPKTNKETPKNDSKS